MLVLSAPALAGSSGPMPDVGIDPFYIGSLLSPNPALSKAGVVAIQPTVLYTFQPGTYDLDGARSGAASRTRSLQTSTDIRYGITDSLTVELIPTTSDLSGPQGFESGSHASDTAVNLDYLVLRQDNRTGRPSITASFGALFPTGRYQNLYNSSDGSGTGTYQARLGLLGQSVLFGESQHPIRLRVYANGSIPVEAVVLHGFTTYGTDGAFIGGAIQGISGSFGAAVEYSFTQKFVFALDVYHGFTTASHVAGAEIGGSLVNFASGSMDTTQIAPALEYSVSDNLGVIAGAALSVAGHNGPAIIQPQVSLNLVF